MALPPVDRWKHCSPSNLIRSKWKEGNPCASTCAPRSVILQLDNSRRSSVVFSMRTDEINLMVVVLERLLSDRIRVFALFFVSPSFFETTSNEKDEPAVAYYPYVILQPALLLPKPWSTVRCVLKSPVVGRVCHTDTTGLPRCSTLVVSLRSPHRTTIGIYHANRYAKFTIATQPSRKKRPCEQKWIIIGCNLAESEGSRGFHDTNPNHIQTLTRELLNNGRYREYSDL